MIDQARFKVEWEILCERFAKTPSVVLATRYYQSLSPQMDTETFVAAARRVFDSNTFFPSPDDFLEAVRPRMELAAGEQWLLCERVMEGERGILERMSPAGRVTVRLLGGAHALQQTALKDVQWVRKDFNRLFEEAEEIERRESRQALPPWTKDGYETFRGLITEGDFPT